MSIQRTLDFCNQAYHTTKMYVQVSEKYIMKRIDHMQLMRTLPLGEHEEGNKKLTEPCEELVNTKSSFGECQKLADV
jgi:hypothetical protein